LYIADTLNNRVRKVTAAGIISTVAGNGVAGLSGNGGQAAAAQLNGPLGVAVDNAGNIYIADTMNNLVRKVAPGGIITTLAGGGSLGVGDGGPATSAQLNGPAGVAVDSSGNLYIADSGNNRVRMVAPGGGITTVAGAGSASLWGDGGPATGSQLNTPGGVSVDSSGNLYIADTGNQRVRMVSNGIINTVAGSGPITPAYQGDGGQATAAQLANPMGVAVDRAGNIYIADSGNYAIREVSGGLINTVAGNNACCLFQGDYGPAVKAVLSVPQGVALAGDGSVYISESGVGRVRKVLAGIITTKAGTGVLGYSNDGASALIAQLSNVAGLAVDSAGNLYIADYGNSRVRMVTLGGTISTVAGNGFPGYSGDNGLATNAQLSGPSGLAMDSAGNLYIADAGGNRVRVVSSTGFISTLAGSGQAGYSGDGGSAAAAQLNAPAGVAVDAAGNVYIADTYNNRVRKVAPGGIITTVAGIGVQGSSGDGGLATSASLNLPSGVVVDGSDNLFISDTGNNRVRRVSPTGIIATVAGTGVSGYSGDGGLGGSAQLNVPFGLASDAAGRVYVADSGNGAVRLLTPVSGSAVIITAFSPLPAASVGVAYSQQLTATGGTPPYTWTVTSGALPSGLTLSSAGLIAGTPTVAVTGTFGITVSDASMTTANGSLTLTVNPTALAIFTSAVLPSGIAGGAYSQTLAAIGGTAPYTWSVFSGVLPPGLTLSTAGLLAGTPTTLGAYNFTVQVQDSASASASQAFSLAVTATGGASRVGVISQLVAGAGWNTTIWLVNRSSSPATATLVFHGDDGSPLTLPFTVTLGGASPQQVTAATLNDVIAPNTTLVVATAALASAPNVQGWADVLSTGPLSGFAIYAEAGVADAAVPLQSQIAASFSLPFDNTGGYSTGVAIVNLAGAPANLTATVWDQDGNQLLTQSFALTKVDTSGNGHDSFLLPTRLPVTAGKRGIVQFQGNPAVLFGPPGALTGLGLRVDPNNLFTSIPTLLP
jgi:sugar lactone lactonase YvrE